MTSADRPAPTAPDLSDAHSAHTLSNTLPDGLLVAGSDRRVRLVNQRALDILKVPVGEPVLGGLLAEVLPLFDAEGRLWWDVASPWVGLASRTGHRERLLWTKAGVEVLVTGRYLRPSRGAPVDGAVFAFRDAMARQRAERDHAALLSTLAHELRSPLTSVKGFSSTLLRRWDRFTDDQKRLIIETIEADADRVTRLVADLLDVSRLESRRLQVRRQEVFLDPLIARHCKRLEGLGIAPDRVLIEVRRPIPDTWADPDRIDQIMINLIDNALTHGAGTVRVTVRPGTVDLEDGAAGDARPAVVVSVSDEGPGVPERLRAVIFTRFWHGPAYGSTGLGLYIVKALVEAHGGRIVATNAPVGGAVLTFSIPSGDPAIAAAQRVS